MKFEESYQIYLTLAEANGTTDKLSTDRGRFAIKYNISQNKVMEWLIESNASDENRYIQSIKVPFQKLKNLSKEENFDNFSLPNNYFDFLDLQVYGSNENCKNQKFRSREVKGSNVDNLLIDSDSDPSFKYRDTFYTIENDSVQVYKKDFNVDLVNISYYRYAKQIELVDPDNPESQFKDEDLEFDDKLINRIIFLAVSLHQLSADDPKFQAFKQETVQKF